MYIQQLYTNCLAQGAYYVESNGEAAIIDPLREVQPYLDLAAERGARIRYIFETHFHADFVSGHVDLARQTGAPIVYGPTQMKTGFDILSGHDGQVFPLGDISLQLIHTPGHTLESSCYLLRDEQGEAQALFTGDTLFVGDVGRPDLAQHVIAELSQEKLAGHLYDSLQNKILPLPDHLIIYPGHGAGSACGKNLGKERWDTLGHQKASNYALRPDLTKAAFIAEVLSGLTPPPGYFPKNVLMNIDGYTPVEEILQRGQKGLCTTAFETAMQLQKALVLDTRPAEVFAKGFIPGALNIGIDGSFAVWAGTLIPDIQQKMLLVSEPGREQEAILRLARVGYDHCIGYLEGGFAAWQEAGKPIDQISCISANDLAGRLSKDPGIALVDVRKGSEFASEHLQGAISLPLDYINNEIAALDKDQTYYVYCAGGYRSMCFISLLKAKGYSRLININGGLQAMKETEGFHLLIF